MEAEGLEAREAENRIQRALLRRAQAGDYIAFEALYALLAPGLRRFIQRLLGHGQEGEDTLQDTFLALYTHLDNIVPASRLRPYAYRIARNHCYDRLRAWRRYDELSLDEGDEVIGPSRARPPLQLPDEYSSPPDEAAHWALMGGEVRRAIECLPEAQRQALLMYFEDELTYHEIAEITGVSIGTVKSRLFHAKKTLRGLVRPEILLAIQQDAAEDEERASRMRQQTP